MNLNEVVKADKALLKKDANLWGAMVAAVVVEHGVPTEASEAKAEAVGDSFRTSVKAARAADTKWEPSGNFRRIRSLIQRAYEFGVPLMDGSKVRGSSAVEADIKEAQGSLAKSAFDKACAAIEAASKHTDKVQDAAQLTAITARMNQLLKMQSERLATMVASK